MIKTLKRLFYIFSIIVAVLGIVSCCLIRSWFLILVISTLATIAVEWIYVEFEKYEKMKHDQ